MSGNPGGAESVPAVLAWALEWIAVPATMLWLWLRWIVCGPVLERPGALTLDERLLKWRARILQAARARRRHYSDGDALSVAGSQGFSIAPSEYEKLTEWAAGSGT